MPALRIASRGSQLALWQANHIADLLRARGHEVHIQVIKTTGDKITDVALSKVGTKGMFTKEIEEALAAGEADLAVHSLKDLPTDLMPGFDLAAITERQDPRDAFLSIQFARFTDLPQRARVGTSSLRRQAQLKAIRPDLDIHPLRGNVDTRLRKLEQGDYQAIILAAAGLNRLGLTASVREILSPDIVCPAVGQGALGIETRSGDAHMRDVIGFLDHHPTRLATTAERALLRTLGGGCQVPIGAFGEAVNGAVRLTAVVARPDGTEILREQHVDRDPEALGALIGKRLLDRGGAAILREVYGETAAVPQQP